MKTWLDVIGEKARDARAKVGEARENLADALEDLNEIAEKMRRVDEFLDAELRGGRKVEPPANAAPETETVDDVETVEEDAQ